MTLLEIMIVIFLIGIISSVVGYNIKGALDRGKEFKMEMAQKKIRDILMMEAAKIHSIELVVNNPLRYLRLSGLVENPQELLKDPWGEKFIIEKDKNGSNILVYSQKNQNKQIKKQEDEDEDY
ncbi:MAG: hypothetical protein JW769_04470 [Parachlamydiales bacterium]|nr:hypothetical protein [Parachlamydiales bacterium]